LIVQEHAELGDVVVPVFLGELDDADAGDLLGGVGEDGEIDAAIAEIFGPAVGVGGGGVGDDEETEILEE
jgi:hypothetical protein